MKTRVEIEPTAISNTNRHAKIGILKSRMSKFVAFFRTSFLTTLPLSIQLRSIMFFSSFFP